MSKGLKVLFLSSDTGGGHRASAESLGAQFELLYPGSTYELIDLVKKHALPPYNKLEESYKHLSANPQQWKMVYHLSNSKAFEYYYDVSQKLYAEKSMRKSILDYDPDVVVSVHPLMTNVPQLCCQNIEKETGKHIPIFTVVTDLATAHALWFARHVDKMYVASDQCRQLAKERGKVPDSKIVQIGLPIRHQFAVQADNLGNRMSAAGLEYQKKIRAELGLPFVDKKTVLVMGGGEGVGSLSNIVDALYIEFTNLGIDAQILVVCGRNEKLKKDLDERDWDLFMTSQAHPGVQNDKKLLGFSQCKNESGSFDSGKSGCMDITVAQQFKRILSNTSLGRISATYALSDIGAYKTEGDEKQEETNVPATAAMDSLVEVSSKDEVDNSFDESQGLEAVDKHTQGKKTSTSNIGLMKQGSVNVVGLGFVTKMAEYMTASDVLVSKAGPGTIAEAAALSLPVMLTSFLPGTFLLSKKNEFIFTQ
jgi:1,2-diacylglycerol 3-beta-galactosyltransferase